MRPVRLPAPRPVLRLLLPTLLALAGLALVVGPRLSADAATPRCHGETATIVGTGGDDELVGTPGRDVVVGLGGDDTIEAGGGRDVVCGDRGADRLHGGRGDDDLYGGGDRLGHDPAGSFLVGDVLLGGAGDDLLVGGRDGRDVDAHRRLDLLSFADAGRRVVVHLPVDGDDGRARGAGRDTIPAGDRVALLGSPYDDRLVGSGGPDVISGAAGDDTLEGGNGSDRIYTETAAVGAPAEPDRDVVVAGRGDDLVSSQGGRDRLATGRGADYVEAFGTTPTLVDAGPGDDRVSQYLTPGRGLGSRGGAGLDRITFFGTLLEGRSPRVEVSLDLADGTYRGDTDPTSRGQLGGYEEVRLAGNLVWEVRGTDGPEKVWGITGGPLDVAARDGNDVLVGTDRPDRLVGGPGRDRVQGNGGEDSCRTTESGSC